MHSIVSNYLPSTWINIKNFAECLTLSLLPSATFISQTDYFVSNQCMGDTRDIFMANLADPKKREDLERSSWVSEGEPFPINYRANRSGWRCDHFTDEPSIVFFGCSFTYGVGMHEDDIWPTKVSKHFNMKCCNLGTPAHNLGASSLYTSLWMQDEIPNAKAFVIKLQAPNRITFFTEDDFVGRKKFLCNITHWITQMYPDSESRVLSKIVKGIEPTSQVNDVKDLLLITSYAEKHNIPVIFADNSQDKYFNKNGDSVARDWGHPGAEWHTHMTNSTIKQLEPILR